VANAVLDGVDAFLLGAETVRGAFPVATLTCVLAICAQAERVFHHSRFFHALLDAAGAFSDGTAGLSARESMASTLVRVAEKTGAQLIVVFTKSGRHAASVAKWRPGVPILALFPPQLHASDGVRWRIGGRAECRAALLRRGVLPMLADPKDGLSEDAMLRSALAFAQATGLVRRGDVVCLSHKLRDDISISVMHVGDEEAPCFGSGASGSVAASAASHADSSGASRRAGRGA
jgi:pyruvate kinase